MLMNVAIIEKDRDVIVFMLCALQQVPSINAVDRNPVTRAVSGPYRCGVAADIVSSITNITRW